MRFPINDKEHWVIYCIFLCVSITKALIINCSLFVSSLLLPLMPHISLTLNLLNKRRKERERNLLWRRQLSYLQTYFKHQIKIKVRIFCLTFVYCVQKEFICRVKAMVQIIVAFDIQKERKLEAKMVRWIMMIIDFTWRASPNRSLELIQYYNIGKFHETNSIVFNIFVCS